MLTGDEMLAKHAAQSDNETANMLAHAVQIVAAQLETKREVEPAERARANARALEIAAQRYPQLVAAVLDANARIYAARIVASGTIRISNACD